MLFLVPHLRHTTPVGIGLWDREFQLASFDRAVLDSDYDNIGFPLELPNTGSQPLDPVTLRLDPNDIF